MSDFILQFFFRQMPVWASAERVHNGVVSQIIVWNSVVFYAVVNIEMTYLVKRGDFVRQPRLVVADCAE